MKEDTPAAMQEPQNEAVGTHQEGPPGNIEATMEINGSTQNLETESTTRRSTNTHPRFFFFGQADW
jgi:hypothetical protein